MAHAEAQIPSPVPQCGQTVAASNNEEAVVKREEEPIFSYAREGAMEHLNIATDLPIFAELQIALERHTKLLVVEDDGAILLDDD